MTRDPDHFTFGEMEIHKSSITDKYVKTAVIDVSPNGADKYRHLYHSSNHRINTVTSTIPQTTG
ncbi:hypothetical protein PIROE2DRAFT_11121 [Piromyces sp. E2]|nr:hypothetical protein PIROE2DRAFT_11121 [Piromyces sp. E2]|eukprot:OUM62543.1 hypothetical protein PIROE2DRAFT_11121 [Piromyces sp. E2]